MLSRPSGLSDDALGQALAAHWGVAPSVLEYQAVGFGSHHWDAREPGGDRWFVTVDEVGQEPGRLHAALATAVALRAAGCDFVVAPLPTRAGGPLALVREFAIALYPHVDGTHFAAGGYDSEEHRRRALDLVVALHRQPLASAPDALEDDFAILCRADLEAGLAGRSAQGDGPFGKALAELLARQRGMLNAALAYYDGLALRVGSSRRPYVITHGEPHAANTIATPDGLVLIDWDTVLVALPERDLFTLDHRDGGILPVYADMTGTEPSTDAIDLYRLQWDLHDIAAYTRRLRRPHDGSEDDEKSWCGLRATVDLLATEVSGWAG